MEAPKLQVGRAPLRAGGGRPFRALLPARSLARTGQRCRRAARQLDLAPSLRLPPAPPAAPQINPDERVQIPVLTDLEANRWAALGAQAARLAAGAGTGAQAARLAAGCVGLQVVAARKQPAPAPLALCPRRSGRAPVARARPPPKRDSKVKKTWDEGERRAAALPSPARLPRTRCALDAGCLPGPSLPPRQPNTPHTRRMHVRTFTCSHTYARTLSHTCTRTHTHAEFWENYRPPAYLTNRYVWAAATAAATVAAVYSASVQRGLLR